VELKKGVGIRQYFKDVPRHSSSSPASETKAEMVTKIQQELMEEMKTETERVWLELEERNRLLRQEFPFNSFVLSRLLLLLDISSYSTKDV